MRNKKSDAFMRRNKNKKYAVKLIAGTLGMLICMSGFILPDAAANNAARGGAYGYNGIIPVNAAENTEKLETLIPLGHTAGVKLISEGVILAGISMVSTEQGNIAPCTKAGLIEGDIIKYIDDQKIISAEHVSEIIKNTNGMPATVRISRNGRLMQFTVTPAKCQTDGCYKLGAWIRDSMAGIGTLTFYDPKSGTFGALGHGVNDIDTAQLIPIKRGSIMDSKVVGIKKGEPGKPGELKGEFDLENDIGELYANTSSGVYGKAKNSELDFCGNPIPIAENNEIKTGKATILSNIDGDEVNEYEIEIVKIFPYTNASSKNMMIKVTDERLLLKAGGIVQGMSGSPIIQNGKLAGAVTHVLINDPQRGYGIFINNMIKDAFWDKMEMVS